MDSAVHSTDQRHFVSRQNSRHVGLGQSERLLVRSLNADLEPQLMDVHIAQVFDVWQRTHTHSLALFHTSDPSFLPLLCITGASSSLSDRCID